MTDPDPSQPADLTVLLSRAAGGDERDQEAFFSSAYGELRRIARHQMGRERKDHTLQATALVHEVWVKLMGKAAVFDDKAHFFAAAAEAMRRILVDHARGRGRQKRGAGRARVPLDALELAHTQDPDEILAIDESLRRLHEVDPRAARIAELRLFAGLDDHETAAVLDVSDRTVRREWVLARAWLQRALSAPT